jgi:hypothetical protein
MVKLVNIILPNMQPLRTTSRYGFAQSDDKWPIESDDKWPDDIESDDEWTADIVSDDGFDEVGFGWSTYDDKWTATIVFDDGFDEVGFGW